MDVAHAGHPVVRHRFRHDASNESGDSLRECDFGGPSRTGPDSQTYTCSACGDGLCHSPAARGSRRVGFGAKGTSFDFFWPLRDPDVAKIFNNALRSKLVFRAWTLPFGSAFKTDASHIALLISRPRGLPLKTRRRCHSVAADLQNHSPAMAVLCVVDRIQHLCLHRSNVRRSCSFG